jgi:hypothetical protein
MAVEPHKHDCDAHMVTLKNHAERLGKLDEILEKVRQRPPVWVTLVFGILLALIGYLTSHSLELQSLVEAKR